ncbi:hypothetical protein OQJ18_09910 [Fluoribacter dumoffii]|uniref:Uncharacterized protein n=1 Tax=Fluoribacter dumoffii TaxID=463 RepID=A0A377G6U2_9GAMM|nr:hypothetical protein [Fluoribacter dumoffii]KTC89334.1 hypothetical protein Ldum_0402 [Fluoribacter dumoffii NY 23]MCW8386907.1 hypothetical protein [Fluoribacter dumoffii]MCW8417589.1 hypothetical protein [Fluoribacter dumoffii]MCW8454570.1 hypothetical protein [Fluoribacter dumoffii]MCW8461354.1 hypothetical protein [Fluoribacter dumoffii]
MFRNNRAMVLALIVGLGFLFSEVQAETVNVDNLSKCMANCKGDKTCVDSCVNRSTTRGTAKEVLQCLAGCGLGVTSTQSTATLKEQIKACCQGCLKAMH